MDPRRPQALSPWEAFRKSGIEVLSSSAVFCFLEVFKLAPLSPAAYSLTYLGLHGFRASQQSTVRTGVAKFYKELFLDGPTLRPLGEWSEALLTHTTAAGAYLCPIVLGALLHSPMRRCMVRAAKVLLRYFWVEFTPWAIAELWKDGGRSKLSWAYLGVGLYLSYPVRNLCAFFLFRRIWPVVAKARILHSPEQARSGLAPYAYKPIAANSRRIRLLEIRPWPASVLPIRLRCDLVEYDLDTAPPFDAISYRWGSGERTHTVKIGQRGLAIPESAFGIIRQRTSTFRTRRLWIDAVCVDQSSDADKSQQVGMMRDIYDKATRTIVWLGDSVPDAWLAWAFFGDLVREYWNSQTDSSNLPVAGLKRINDNSPKWKALCLLLENEYWSRVWIVQEIVVSRQVDIFFSGTWYDWALFAPVIGSLKDDTLSNGLLEKMDRSEGMSTPPFLAIHRIQLIEKLRNEYRRGEIWTLPYVLASFGTSRATNDKDYVFAFQGICTTAAEQALVPDYAKPAFQVFREASLYALTHPPAQHSLLMLSIAGVGHTRPGVSDWPSWVPDFHAISQLGHKAPLLHSYASYQAGTLGGLPPVVRPGSVGNEIVLAGVFIDSIAAVTQIAPLDKSHEWRGLGESGSDEEKQGAETILYTAARYREAEALCESHCAPTYQLTGQSRWDAFWRTYIGNKSLDSYPAGDEYGDHVKTFIDSLERYGQALRDGAPINALVTSELKSAFAATQDATPQTPESLLRTTEKLFPLSELDPEMSLETILTPSLLAGGAPAIFDALATATSLPSFDRSLIRTHLLKTTSNPATPPPAHSNYDRALGELFIRASEVLPHDTSDAPVRRSVLLLAFMLSLPGSGTNMSDAQAALIRQLALKNVATNESGAKRIGMLVGAAAARRGFAVTRRGYIGLVPQGAMEGDVVAVFLGGKVVHVLRLVGEGRWALVGEGYLHGFMDGEVFAWGGEEGVTVEGITLV
ncbi:heterokaryon incompatibility protein-domain-containing protein [Lasiosphaeria hispida]|uniref:Heterokaryon incompatibility protein-domain-containing protein n=1 Tax=Lasiosphaeria hispida TaxID=260671 RepID=A0AAJ0HJR9_9PEZI|nr:heterokaryon incompatibility protein-domain-containing protein [Lasiosphaeria hispida]